MKVFHGNDTQPNLRVTTQTEVLCEEHFAGRTGAGFQKVLEFSASMNFQHPLKRKRKEHSANLPVCLSMSNIFV
jgi:hypothetical protein